MHRLLAGLLATACIALTACETPPGAGGVADPNRPRLSPVLERMRANYADLERGRFVSLADFEDPAQVRLFRVVGDDGSQEGQPQPGLSILRSRNETGAGSLKVRLSSSRARLLFDGERSPELALLRDWRPYALLMQSVYGPKDGAVLEFTVASGDEPTVTWSQSIDVRPGWNLVRLDLATIGSRVDLGDVRALSWCAPHSSEPVDVYLDDIVIADNTRYLFGEDAVPGELYALTRGLRIRIGSPGRFELAFAGGVIAEWRAPNMANLADPLGLGPWPMPLAADWSARPEDPPAYDAPDLVRPWGTEQVAAQELLEASPFRVVVRGRRTFAAGASGRLGTGRPGINGGHEYTFVVYPCGRVCVRISSIAAMGDWAAPRVGYAIGLDARQGFQHVAAPPADAHREPVAFALLSGPGPQRPDLLWTSPAPGAVTHHRAFNSTDGRRLTLVVGDVPASAEVDTIHLLRVWPHDIDGNPEAESFAADYQHPAELRPTAGRLITSRSGDLDVNGFNEAEACYELGLDEGVLRVEFDPGALLRFDTVFRVAGTESRRCWVYARGRRIGSVGRDAEGRLLFTLGRVTSQPTLIEVHTRPAEDVQEAGNRPRTGGNGASLDSPVPGF